MKLTRTGWTSSTAGLLALGALACSTPQRAVGPAAGLRPPVRQAPPPAPPADHALAEPMPSQLASESLGDAAAMPSVSGVVSPRSAGARPARKAAPRTRAPSPPIATTPIQQTAAKPEPIQAQPRKVHYDGYAKLVAAKPDELLGHAAQRAKDAGGHIESWQGSRLILRVPVGVFRAVLAQVLELGEVLAQRITAQDITDAYQAVELRKRVFEASRNRLMQLLGKVRNEHEKLSLLSEIKRLTEHIDQLQLRLQSLASLADYSRITVEAAPRPPKMMQLAQMELGALRWIGRLSPFRRDVSNESDVLELPVPEGLVAPRKERSFFDFFGSDEPWVAHSPNGVAIWSSQRENNPAGDAAFWIAALRHRLELQYPKHTEYRVGGFHVLELQDTTSRQKYRYLVAVRVAGDELHVVEVYYPSLEHQEQYGKAIKAALTRASGGKEKS